MGTKGGVFHADTTLENKKIEVFKIQRERMNFINRFNYDERTL